MTPTPKPPTWRDFFLLGALVLGSVMTVCVVFAGLAWVLLGLAL